MKAPALLLLTLALLMAGCAPSATPAAEGAMTPTTARPTPHDATPTQAVPTIPMAPTDSATSTAPTAPTRLAEPAAGAAEFERESTPTPLPFAPRIEVVAAGLEVPWSLAFAPDGRLFFTERPGRLRVIVDGVLQPEPLATFEVVDAGEGGLLGIALDPDFDHNALLYAVYTYRAGGASWNRVARYEVAAAGLGPEQVLLEGIPGAQVHDGGRLAFGPDGKLYITTGDARVPALAQEADSLAGKILRLNPDGTVPVDNPFPGSPVYSLGHRNPQGLAWDVNTGALYSTEHGPSGEQSLCCRDELNRIEPRGNYGWPLVTAAPGEAGYLDPLLHSGDDTWAPAGLLVYDGEALAPWRGSLLFGALRGQHLQRVELADDGVTVVAVERLFVGELGRIRDVAQGPDGYVYFTTSNRDGRGRPAAEDDRILRIVPR